MPSVGALQLSFVANQQSDPMSERMTDIPVEAKLLTSQAFLSLSSEQRVHATLIANGWRAQHGTFYRDPDSKKPRELDVTAVRRWEASRKAGNMTLSLDLLIEVKSARGFHLLFAPHRPKESAGYLLRYWIGYEGRTRRRLLRDLARRLDERQLAAVAARLNSIAYPQHFAAPRSIMVNPPSLEWAATGFRETNIGSEKDLDNSVVWRAGQALRSAFRSYRDLEYRRQMEWTLSELQDDPEARRDPVASVLGNLHWQVRQVAQFHPIVVVDAELWVAQEAHVRKVPWCRFAQVDRAGHPQWWWDVVHSASVADYVQHITRAYDKAVRPSRARLEAFVG